MFDNLWAGWRTTYVQSDDPNRVMPEAGLTLFETILASDLPDDETLVLWRGQHVVAILNAYPYTSGHLMVLPKRGVPALSDLESDEYHELWEGVRLAVLAVEKAYRPDGVNVGANLGAGAGAGVPDHLHVHVLPRWAGDTNFMTTIANTRVMPESLADTWKRLNAAWPV